MSRAKVKFAPDILRWSLFIILATFLVLGSMWAWQNFIQKPAMEVIPEKTETKAVEGTLPISWTVNSIWIYDETDVDTWGSMKVYDPNWNLIGTLTDDTATSLTLPQGVRQVKLLIDYGTPTIKCFVAVDKQLTQSYFKGWGVFDKDNDGTKELYFDVDFSTLGELKGGETEKKVVSNLFLMKVDDSLTITKTVEPSGCNTAGDKYAEGYVSSFSEGYAFRVVYIKATLPNSANGTYADPANGYFILKDITINGKSYTDVGAFDTSGLKWTILSKYETDEPENGDTFYFDRNLGSTWCNIKVHAYTRFPATEKVIQLTLVITYVLPDGTTGTLSQTFNFSS